MAVKLERSRVPAARVQPEIQPDALVSHPVAGQLVVRPECPLRAQCQADHHRGCHEQRRDRAEAGDSSQNAEGKQARASDG